MKFLELNLLFILLLALSLANKLLNKKPLVGDVLEGQDGDALAMVELDAVFDHDVDGDE